MSGPNLRVYKALSTQLINVIQGCAISGLPCKILFPAKGIQNVAIFGGKFMSRMTGSLHPTYIPRKAVLHMEFGYFG